MSAPEPSAGPPAASVSSSYLRVLARYRRLLIANVGGAAVVSAIVVLLLPSWYRAQTVILPPQEEPGGLTMASVLAGIKVPGVSLPGTATPTEVYLAVLRSRFVFERVVRQFDLQARYKAKNVDDAILELRTHTGIKTADEGTMVVSVEDKDSRRAAEMANAFVRALDEFNRGHRSNRSRATRVFVERRLEQTRVDLRASEEAMVVYQRTHKGAVMTADVKDAAESGARLAAERMSVAARLEAYRTSMAPTNPQVTELQNSLDALDRQLGTLPTIGIEIARLYRTLRVNEELYALLVAQFEEARINEARDTPTVDVLDAATPPFRRSRPQRKVVVLTCAALGAVWGALLAFGLEMRAASRRAA